MSNVVAFKQEDDWVKQVHDLIKEGESAFHKAAVIMQRQIDEGMTTREVAKALGKSQTWVCDHLKWLNSGTVQKTPFSGQGPKKRRQTGDPNQPSETSVKGRILDVLKKAPSNVADICHALPDVNFDTVRLGMRDLKREGWAKDTGKEKKTDKSSRRSGAVYVFEPNPKPIKKIKSSSGGNKLTKMEQVEQARKILIGNIGMLTVPERTEMGKAFGFAACANKAGKSDELTVEQARETYVAAFNKAVLKSHPKHGIFDRVKELDALLAALKVKWQHIKDIQLVKDAIDTEIKVRSGKKITMTISEPRRGRTKKT